MSYYQSDEYKLKEKILSRLMRDAGLCAHCGKFDCVGKQSHCVLPHELSLTDVMSAIRLDTPEENV